MHREAIIDNRPWKTNDGVDQRDLRKIGSIVRQLNGRTMRYIPYTETIHKLHTEHEGPIDI